MKKSATAAPKSKAPREALKDRSNLQREEEEIVVAVPTKKNSRKALPKGDDENTEPAAKRAKITKAAVSQPRSAKAASTSKKRAPSPDALPVIPETQPIEDISESIEVNPESAIDEPEVEIQPVAEITASRARSISHQPQAQSYIAPSRARSTSQQPRSYSREGSAALAERRLAEADTRRRLSEITSKYEDMRLKYESLSELGTNAAATQFDKLKRATDQRAKDANELIATLKKELSEARKSTSSSTTDNAKLQTQLSTAEASQEQARTELKDAQASLLEAQNEVKALTAKLEAARDAARKAASVAAADKTPGSAIKTRGTLGGSNLDSAKQAALKEELYRDLTGLIINSVKRKEGEDEYSCIQTGRNGSKCHCFSRGSNAGRLTIARSATLPPIDQQRRHADQPQDAERPGLRGCRIRVRAFLRRRPRSRPHRHPARLPDRGNLLPAQSRRQVLHESRRQHDQESCH